MTVIRPMRERPPVPKDELWSTVLDPEVEARVRLGETFTCGRFDAEGWSGTGGGACRVRCRTRLSVMQSATGLWRLRCPIHGPVGLPPEMKR